MRVSRARERQGKRHIRGSGGGGAAKVGVLEAGEGDALAGLGNGAEAGELAGAGFCRGEEEVAFGGPLRLGDGVHVVTGCRVDVRD